MLKSIVTGLASACLLAVAAPAAATTYVLHADGVIDDPTGPLIGLSQGQTISFDAVFDDLFVLPTMTAGVFSGLAFGQNHGPPSAYAQMGAPWSITAGPWTWGANFDLNAGILPIFWNFTQNGQQFTNLGSNPIPGADYRLDLERVLYAGPSATFSLNGVVGIFGQSLMNWASTTQPQITSSGATFVLRGPAGSGFTGPVNGHWDLANSTVTVLGAAVPEPASWAMLILGFGGIGVMMRRRKTAPAAA